MYACMDWEKQELNKSECTLSPKLFAPIVKYTFISSHNKCNRSIYYFADEPKTLHSLPEKIEQGCFIPFGELCSSSSSLFLVDCIVFYCFMILWIFAK